MKKNKLIRILRNIILISIFLYLVWPIFIGSTCCVDSPEMAARRMEQRAQIDIRGFQTGLIPYRLDTGRYPSTSEGLNALIQAPKGKSSKWKGPYIEVAQLRDPWGNAYLYRYPGKYNINGSRSYDLWSWGPDGVQSDDDIGNW